MVWIKGWMKEWGLKEPGWMGVLYCEGEKRLEEEEA